MVGGIAVPHAVADVVRLRAMADAGDPHGIQLALLDVALGRQHHRAAAAGLRAAVEQLDGPGDVAGAEHLLHRRLLAQVGVRIFRRLPAVLDHDPRHVLLGHAVLVHVADGGHGQHADGAERELPLIGRVQILLSTVWLSPHSPTLSAPAVSTTSHAPAATWYYAAATLEMPVAPPVLMRRKRLLRPPTASTPSRSALPMPTMASGESE